MRRRSWKRIFGNAAAAALAGPALYLAAALGLALIPVNRNFVPADEGVDIFLLSNGIHVDFVVPATSPAMDWSGQLARTDFAGVDQHWSHVCLGWGDRDLYLETPQWKDLKLATATRAVFWPTPSVVHAQYVRAPPRDSETCRRVRLSHAAYRDLCAYLKDSFQQNGSGQVILIPGRGYSSTDNFYEGSGSYHAFNTCNQWANGGLKRIGVRTALWSPFAGGILRHAPPSPDVEP
jgi:uncharacterized protein (TIGR02117 family)